MGTHRPWWLYRSCQMYAMIRPKTAIGSIQSMRRRAARDIPAEVYSSFDVCAGRLLTGGGPGIAIAPDRRQKKKCFVQSTAVCSIAEDVTEDAFWNTRP